MTKMQKSLLLGVIAGIIDVIPMIAQKLTWDANLSAFFFWVVTAFFIAKTDLKLKGAIKGISIAITIMFPTAILIGWGNPISLLPILIMTLILGSLLGWRIDKIK